MVAKDPLCGEVMSGTGGFRKVRVRRGSIGKSGGARVVYIWRSDKFEKANLTKAERNTLKKHADDIFDSCRR